MTEEPELEVATSLEGAQLDDPAKIPPDEGDLQAPPPPQKPPEAKD